MHLSRRLQTLLDATLPDAPMADIGTDHALVPVAAVRSGRVPRAIGIDRAAEPLCGARRRVRDADLAGRIDLRLGEGLEPLRPDDGVRTVVVAGLGARVVGSALFGEEGRLDALGVERLVLQPLRSARSARATLLDRPDWQIVDERLVEEGGYFYVTFVVDRMREAIFDGAEEPGDWDETERLVGRHLRRRGGAALGRYLELLAGLLERRLRSADLEAMPDEVRERLQRRLDIYRTEAGRHLRDR
jgi:tRNA A22 N-methylase